MVVIQISRALRVMPSKLQGNSAINAICSRKYSSVLKQDTKSRQSFAIEQEDIIFPEQIVQTFAGCKGDTFLDFTFGSGGHTQKLLEHFPSARVIAVDRDPSTKEYADNLKNKYPKRLCYLNIKFSEVVPTLQSLGVFGGSIAGAVLDCGPSLQQLYIPERGFSAGKIWPIDMRMDGPSTSQISALDVLKSVDEESLFKILKYYGLQKSARRLASCLIRSRYELVTLRTPDDLITFIKGVAGIEFKDDHLEGESHMPSGPDDEIKSITLDTVSSGENGIHTLATVRKSIPDDNSSIKNTEVEAINPDGKVHRIASGVFRALRIFVNNELNELDCAIKSAHYLLDDSAPLAAISYNPLENTIIKRHFSGLNVDASPETIGKPQHRSPKGMGLVQQNECFPWEKTNKFILKTRWDQKFKHSHWKDAILRTANKIASVTYDE